MSSTSIIPIRGLFSNAYLLKGEQTILVDTGGIGQARAILSALGRAGISPADISLILHTHGHWDHAGSTVALGATLEAPTMIHRGDLPYVSRGKDIPLHPQHFFSHVLMHTVVPKSFEPFEPDLVIDGPISLEAYGVAAWVVHTPGHTPGSISVVTESGEAVVGDVLMGGRFGGLLFPGFPRKMYFLEDATATRRSLKKLLALRLKSWHPGHGGPLDPQSIAARLKKLA